MKKSFTLATVLTLALAFNGCGDSNNGGGKKGDELAVGSELPESVSNAIASEKSALSQELLNTLSYMGNEERLAYDVYNKLYSEWGTKQFTNIATKSEYKHITAVQHGLHRKSGFNPGAKILL